MRSLLRLLPIILLLSFVFAVPASAGRAGQDTPGARDLAAEQEIDGRLAAISPEAVPVFDQATLDMDQGRFAEAERGYERVLTLAPDFPDALRRLSYVKSYLDKPAQAVGLARRAYDIDKGPVNAGALAKALLGTGEAQDEREAHTLAKQAAAQTPDDFSANLTLMLTAIAVQDMAVIRQADETLLRLEPDFAYAHFVAGLLAMDGEKWHTAVEELERARELGAPEEDVTELLAEARQHVRESDLTFLWLKRGGIVFGGWLGSLGLLFVAGLVLSRATLVAVKRPPEGDAFRLSPGEQLVRSIYGGVIGLTSLYFYISLPLLALTVILLCGGLIYAMLRSGRINIYLLVMLGLMGFYTVVAIVRSLFIRVKESEPGRPLKLEEAPGLWNLTREIAGRVGARPVDAIYITAGSEIGVTERGSMLRKLRGAGKRLLTIGLGALPGMTQGEFSAILAHEYGHFSNRDTAGGNMAFQVRVSMYNMAFQLARRGQASKINPAWLFINGFSKVFYRVTLGASRLQEILADRYAATAYGAKNLIEGLTRIVRQSFEFDAQVEREARRATAQGHGMHNLYTLPDLDMPEDREEVDRQVREAMTRPTSPYDSHPAFAERVRLLEPLAGQAGHVENLQAVDKLFANLPALQEEMTGLVQRNVYADEKADRAARADLQVESAKAAVPEIRPYYLRLSQATRSGDAGLEAEAWQELGDAYSGRGLAERALSCYESALNCYVDLQDREGERVARYNIAEAYRELGRTAEAALQMQMVVKLDQDLNCPDLASDQAELAEIENSRLKLEE